MLGFRFGDGFEMQTGPRTLTKNDQPIKLGARAFDLLGDLIAHRGSVVTREDLLRRIWPETVVGENNLNVQIANLRRILGPEAVVTVTGRGVRFGLAVEVIGAGGGPSAVAQDRPSVAVLPFQMLSAPAELAWLTEGCVEDITTELSRFKDFFVISRNSAAVFDEVPRDLGAVARQLGVRYVVEGALRVAAGRVRATAQLIEAGTGRQVWADKFDATLDDIFDVQHQIATAVVGCLAPQIEKSEAQLVRAQVPQNLTAHGHARRAWTIISDGEEMTPDPARRAAAMAAAAEAIVLDDGSALAWRTLSWGAWWDIYHGTAASVPDTLTEGIAAADRAIGIDATDHHARRLKGLLLMIAKRPEASLAELRRAVEINPNCAVTLAWMGMLEAIHGEGPLGVQRTAEALRLSPLDPSRGTLLIASSFANFAMGNYKVAAEAAEEALAEVTAGTSPLVIGAIAHVGAGTLDRAREMFARLEAIAPDLARLRLNGVWVGQDADYIERSTAFLRVAAGQEDPSSVLRLMTRGAA